MKGMSCSGAPAARRAAKRSPILIMNGKEEETHEWIFSWLSLLAVLLVGAYARRRQRRRSSATWRPNTKYVGLAALERFSIECRKTKTKVITLSNHKGHR